MNEMNDEQWYESYIPIPAEIHVATPEQIESVRETDIAESTRHLEGYGKATFQPALGVWLIMPIFCICSILGIVGYVLYDLFF